MRNLFLLLLSTASFISAFAQPPRETKISGTLTDSLTQKPLGKVTVTLLQNTKTISSTPSTDKGSFVFQNIPYGSYVLTFTSVGYAAKSLDVSLSAEQPDVNTGTLSLLPDGKQLSNVTVTAQKALIEDKGDRLIYNAEKDISNAGGTAADVLRKVPNLTVDLN